VFDLEETLTHEETLLRFRAIFRRDMTPEERDRFFLSPDTSVEPDAEKP
jgi:hypothetical protein